MEVYFLKKAIICIMLILLIGCSKKEINEKELIVDYVKNNETILIECVNKIKESEKIIDDSIINNLPEGLKIYNIYKSNQTDCINFSVDEGTTSSSHYYGFYYTPKDVASIIGYESENLKEYGNGYRIQEEGNEDWYYTEKIVDNFYFYEEHY